MNRAGRNGDGLAIHGGEAVRATPLRYGAQSIVEEDIQAVVDVLRSDWVTQGPKVKEFEETFAQVVGARYAVAFSSGTAGLHAAAFAAGLGPGDEVITTPLTFCATANCALYLEATPRFADVQSDTLNIDPNSVQEKLTPRTKVLIPVAYAGHPADLDALLKIASSNDLIVIEDACHALGAQYRGRALGSVSDMTVFSFHPVKHITTGEGGMVTTNDQQYANRMRTFRSHGVEIDQAERARQADWFYEMVSLGYNYRIPDVSCALGLSQLTRLEENLVRRKEIASRYQHELRNMSCIIQPVTRPDVEHAWHLFPVRLELSQIRGTRGEIFRALQAEGIGVNVHYVPVHLHRYYRERFGYSDGEHPVAEAAYEQLLSLPMFHAMTESDIDDVILSLDKVLTYYAK